MKVIKKMKKNIKDIRKNESEDFENGKDEV